MATKDEVRALEKVVEDLKTKSDKGEGRSMGIGQMIGWIAAGSTVIGVLINLAIKMLQK